MKCVLADAGTRFAARLSRTKIQRQLHLEHFVEQPTATLSGEKIRRRRKLYRHQHFSEMATEEHSTVAAPRTRVQGVSKGGCLGVMAP